MARAKKSTKTPNSSTVSDVAKKDDGSYVMDPKPAVTKKNIKIGDKKKNSKSKTVINFKRYLHMVLKQVHPECGMTSKSMSIMNTFMFDIMEQIANEASKLCKRGKTKTLSSRDIQTSTRLILPGDLAKHAISEGTKAVSKYLLSIGSSRAQTTTPKPE